MKAKYFRRIFDNDFDPINSKRFCDEVSIGKAQSKYTDLGKIVEVKMKDYDASEFEIKCWRFRLGASGLPNQAPFHA